MDTHVIILQLHVKQTRGEPITIEHFVIDTIIIIIIIIIFQVRKFFKSSTDFEIFAWPGKFSVYHYILNVKKILAVINATYAVAKRKPEKNQACRDSNPDLCDTGAAL